MTTTNDRAAVELRIARIIAYRLGVFPSDIGLDTSLSMSCPSRSEIWQDIRKRFRLEIPEADAEKIKTVGQAVDYVMGRK